MTDDYEVTSELTESDAAEPDDFVRKQLMLGTALQVYFGAREEEVRTLFRNDLVGVGLFVARGQRVMQALCRRSTSTSQWRICHLAPAPHWAPYVAGTSRLGVLVKRSALSDAHPGDFRRCAVLDDAAYELLWDVERP